MTERELRAGDLVSYRKPDRGSTGHVGRVSVLRDTHAMVAGAGSTRRRVELKDIEGWWPRGSRDRSSKAMRRLLQLALVLATAFLAGCSEGAYGTSLSDCTDAAHWHADQEVFWTSVNETRAAWHREQRHRFEHAREIGAECTWWNKGTPWGGA